VKNAKVEKIPINGAEVMIIKQNKWKPDKPFSIKWEKNKVLMGGELFYFN
jgi:hypothetical protein